MIMRCLLKDSWDVETKLTYHCRHCSFVWDSWDGNFQKVLAHEKAHKITPKKKKQAKANILSESED